MVTNSGPTQSTAGQESRRPGRWLALAVLLTGSFVTVLDLFIVNGRVGEHSKGSRCQPRRFSDGLDQR